MLVLAFTAELSHLEPEEFVDAVLHDVLHAPTVVVGRATSGSVAGAAGDVERAARARPVVRLRG